MSVNVPLRQEEKILMTLHRHLATYGWQFFGIFILIGLPFFFMFKLFQIERWGMIIFSLPLIIAVFLIIRLLFLWHSNVLIVTNERLIDIERKKLFHRELHEIGWQKVQSIGSEIKGILSTIFKIGVVKIETHGFEYDFESLPMRHPDKIQVELSRILELFDSTHNKEEGSHAARAIDHIKHLSVEEIKDVQKGLDERLSELKSENN